MDSREQAEKLLLQAADMYESRRDPEGLMQVASVWLAVWEQEEFPNREPRFGFRVQTDAEGEEIGESE